MQSFTDTLITERLRRISSLHNGLPAMKTNVQPHKNSKLCGRRKHKATCWRVRMIRARHKTEHKKTTNPVSAHREAWWHKTDTPPVFPTQLTSHKIWNKRKQLSDCSCFNAWHHVHGPNRANSHLFRVSGIETGRGKTMAKCLCYWITKADSWLFAFTRSHSALGARWWKPHRYKGHCYKRPWLCVGEQEIL